jgi:hypothetical protein
MTALYQMPARALPERPRLDGLLRDMGDWLGEALEREGFASSEWICLRRVHSRVRIPLAASDETIAAKWALSVAAAVRVAAESGSSDVVRYRSRSHALMDLVERVLEGDFNRSWAWRQLGLTRFLTESHDERELLEYALQSEPQLLVRIIVKVAVQGRLPVLLRKLTIQDWKLLASVAWSTAGGSSLSASLPAFQPDLPENTFAPADEDALQSRVEGILRRSAIVRALRQNHDLRSSGLCGVIAVFALLECDPSAAGRESSIAPGGASAIAAVAAAMAGQPQPSPGNTPKSQLTEQRRSGDREAFRKTKSAGELESVSFESRFGGLMLVLRLFVQLDLFPRLVEALPQRHLSWTMQQLALRLVPGRENDPAVLAFSGCTPADVSPAQDEPAPSLEEEATLDVFVTNIADELESRLSDLELKRDRLLQFVCHRWCRIEADPGWIQIHFSLTDVSTDIRRAALDLDPGYIRALGVAVVFHYE